MCYTNGYEKSSERLMGVDEMHILAVGLNYKTAPVEIREKLTFSEGHTAEAMHQLNGRKSVLENVIISTCNRTEIYAVVDQLPSREPCGFLDGSLGDLFNYHRDCFSYSISENKDWLTALPHFSRHRFIRRFRSF